MFSRLLKHEWRANSGLLGLLSLAAGGIGILATAILRFLLNAPASWDDFVPEALADMIGVAMYVFLFFAAVALSVYAVAVQIILLYRFYRNKYTDEGYLTFTLPVTPAQIFWSSFLNMLLWLVISMAVVAASIFLVVFVGTAQEGLFNWKILEILEHALRIFTWEYWEAISTAHATTYIVLAILKALLAPFYALAMPLACITAGAVVAKKHKILASFGVYYVVNFVVGIMNSVAALAPHILFLNDGAINGVISGVFQLSITLGLTVGAYCFTIHTMKKKLNLP